VKSESIRGAIRELEREVFGDDDSRPAGITVLPSDSPEAMNEALWRANPAEWQTLMQVDRMDAGIPPCS
jgi:hypothetical protein